MSNKSTTENRQPTTICSSDQSSVVSEMYGFEKLSVWQKAMDFCEHIYKATESFPREELFGLTSQLRRASSSIPLNIAEGSASKSKKEFKHFLTIALRSQYECITLLKLCIRLNFLSKDDYSNLFRECNEVGRLLNALIKSQASSQRSVLRKCASVASDQKTRNRKTENRQPTTET